MSTTTYTNPFYNPNSELCLEVRQWILDHRNDLEQEHIPLTPGWNKPAMYRDTSYMQTAEYKKLISNANKGKTAWNKGKTGIYSVKTLSSMSKNTAFRKQYKCNDCTLIASAGSIGGHQKWTNHSGKTLSLKG